jgi:glycolate oxidase FAD binding subunit
MARRAIRPRSGATVTAPPVSDSAAAVADRVRCARADRSALRIVGAGSWLDAGRPVSAGQQLNVPSLVPPGVVHYEPGDLTLTARATTPLAELERIARAEGQWLPLDPFGSPNGTLGATVATGSAGPLASAYGTPREQVLGCEFVSGAGDIVRAGGRVVKNVAGFDLVRLMTGAWGTLGILTEISVRLRALPAMETALAVPASANDAWRWLRASEFTPLAAELLSPALARSLGVGTSTTLLLRLGGNVPLVRAAEESVGSLGAPQRVDHAVWQALAMWEPERAAVIRLSSRPSRLAPLWDRASTMVERIGGFAHATPQRGVVRCILPMEGESDEECARLRGIIGTLRMDATCIAERLPASLWSSLMAPMAADALSHGIRAAFDPDRILNPGILGEPA